MHTRVDALQKRLYPSRTEFLAKAGLKEKQWQRFSNGIGVLFETDIERLESLFRVPKDFFALPDGRAIISESWNHADSDAWSEITKAENVQKEKARIESEKDKSLSRNGELGNNPPNSSKEFTKVDRYKWNTNIGKKGAFLEIDKNELMIDEEYQRGLYQSRVNKIARNWFWPYAKTLTVVKRGNGSFFVVDGQHRLMAARKRPDVKVMPCMVFETLEDARDHISREEEADLFIGGNTGVATVSIRDKMGALLLNGDEPAVALVKDLDMLGYQFHKLVKNKRKTALDCIGTLYDAYKSDRECAREALRCAAMLTGGRRFKKMLYQALFGFAKNAKKQEPPISAKKWQDRIVAIGEPEVVDSIHRYALAMNSHTEKAWTLGLIEKYNYKLANRVEWRGK